MKFTILSVTLSLLCACAGSSDMQSAMAPMSSPKPLSIQIGNNWQIIEEAPKLSDERGHLPVKMEPMLPEGAKTVSPADNRKLETLP